MRVERERADDALGDKLAAIEETADAVHHHGTDAGRRSARGRSREDGSPDPYD
jgi:hypothetical protein